MMLKIEIVFIKFGREIFPKHIEWRYQTKIFEVLPLFFNF